MDFPPGLFSDEELKALRKERIKVFDEFAYQYIDRAPSTLHDLQLPGVSRKQEEPDVFVWCQLRRLEDYVSKLPASEHAGLRYLDLPQWENKGREYFPANEPWILRNLTTKQIVRAEAIAMKPGFIHGPYINVLGFGEVILSRICWSSSPPRDMMDPTNICRGVWAGHCFDITTLARHQDETRGGGGWTDASDEVAKELATIWESNLPLHEWLSPVRPGGFNKSLFGMPQHLREPRDPDTFRQSIQ
ncbi:F-box domain containing protein [Ophiocordyceps sinensis CO18]|uniref:F-box domain containing protein n=1 Tax=Ophiocordyceps sinensis (strain Co18 / CGMCC 3.14243) TaxID=911162 RepID=T5A7E8_OPHSC|nr:F-box domain containing protein [Ophiocordyceps sinensis CO18]